MQFWMYSLAKCTENTRSDSIAPITSSQHREWRNERLLRNIALYIQCVCVCVETRRHNITQHNDPKVALPIMLICIIWDLMEPLLFARQTSCRRASKGVAMPARYRRRARLIPANHIYSPVLYSSDALYSCYTSARTQQQQQQHSMAITRERLATAFHQQGAGRRRFRYRKPTAIVPRAAPLMQAI